MALSMIEIISKVREEINEKITDKTQNINLNMRIGIHTVFILNLTRS